MKRRMLLSNNQKFAKYLIAYYPFDIDYNDKISPPINLNGTNSANLSTGIIGNAAFCPASTVSSIRNISSVEKLSFSNGTNDVPYSISFHLFVKSVGSTHGAVLAKGAFNTSLQATNSEYRILINSAGTQLSFTKYSQGTFANATAYTITAPPKNTWLHIVITDDSAGNVKIYINGVIQVMTVANVGTGFLKYSITGNSNFVCLNEAGTSTTTRFVEGGIDDLGFFKNYVLTQEDIDFIYNAGNSRTLK